MSPIDYRSQTTLITGASSGLGAEFARQLAVRGSDLVLVARRTERLESLAAELRATHGVTATVISQDLSLPDAGATLASAVNERGITVTSLINNAGFGSHGEFHETEASVSSGQIALNIAALVDVTRAFIDDLRASSGILVNVASTAAYQPLPGMAVYGATKAFVLNFSEAIWGESRDTHLRVLAISPGATRTEFFDIAGSGAQVGDMQTSEQVVGLALATLDRRTPPPSIISGFANRVAPFAARFVSRRLLTVIGGRVMNRESPASTTVS
jgi:short-subunit dehydrogenase